MSINCVRDNSVPAVVRLNGQMNWCPKKCREKSVLVWPVCSSLLLAGQIAWWWTNDHRFSQRFRRAHARSRFELEPSGYALRALEQVEAAKGGLLAAEVQHGKKSALLHYDLACYFCLLGDQAEARRRLRIACKMDKLWKKTALENPDLKTMWDDIAAMK